MIRFWCIALSVLSFGIISQPSYACRFTAPLEVKDIEYADVVVIGRVSNYEVIRDFEFRKKMLSRPNVTADMRRTYGKSSTLLVDYARFDVQVSEYLKGKVPDEFSVTWDNSTFGVPDEIESGPFLIALRYPSSKAPHLRGPSATIFPNKEPDKLTVLQAPCSRAFILPLSDSRIADIKRLLKR